jgi:hypothetical protein
MEQAIAYRRHGFPHNMITKLNISQKRPPLLERAHSADDEDSLGLNEGASDHEMTELNGSVNIMDDSSNAMACEEVRPSIPANGLGDNAQGHSLSSKSHRPPTVTGAEVRAIRAAQELFMSNSFKLQVSLLSCICVSCYPSTKSPQIDALLPNIRPKNPRNQLIDGFLFSLHAYLSSLPSLEPQHPLAAARALSDIPFLSSLSTKKMSSQPDGTASSSQTISIPYPLPTPTEDANWKVAFEKPVDITIVGSWINNVAVKRKDDEPWVVDVAVEMPPASLMLRCRLFDANFSCHSAYFKKKII